MTENECIKFWPVTYPEIYDFLPVTEKVINIRNYKKEKYKATTFLVGYSLYCSILLKKLALIAYLKAPVHLEVVYQVHQTSFS